VRKEVKWLSLLFSICLLLGSVKTSSSLTLADLKTQTRLFLRDTGASGFDDAQLEIFLNNAQKEVNTKVWAVINSTSITLVSGTTEYSLPTNFITVLRVTSL